MKRLLIVLAFCVPALAQSGPQFNWTPASNPTLANGCPATSPEMCLSHYTLLGAGVSTIIPVNIKLPFVLSPAPGPGTYVYTLTLNGFDQSGTAISSTPVTATLTIAAPTSINPPANFTATVTSAGVTLRWTNGNPTLGACSGATPKDCEQSLNLTDNGVSIASCSNSSNASCTAQTTFSIPMPKAGTHTYGLSIGGFNASGTSITSLPATATVNVGRVSINSPTGFTAIQ
jgi:hypothetical protein